MENIIGSFPVTCLAAVKNRKVKKEKEKKTLNIWNYGTT